MSEEQLKNIKGQIKCELPNKDLHSFKGNIIINDEEYTLTDK